MIKSVDQMTLLCKKKITVIAFKDFFPETKARDTIEDSFARCLIRDGFKATLMRTLRAENRSEGSAEKRRDCRHRQTLYRVKKIWLAYRQNTNFPVMLMHAFFSRLTMHFLQNRSYSFSIARHESCKIYELFAN